MERSVIKIKDEANILTRSGYIQQRELVLSSDQGVLLVDQHKPLLHHSLLLLFVVAWRVNTKTSKH